jgi:membrane protease YdiL (CAAX protease family)
VRVGVAGTLAMWLAVVGVGSACAAITRRHDTEPAVALLGNLKGPVELGLFLAVACVFAPIVEELTFRVLIFNALTKYASIAVAAIASGVLFGAEHVISTPPEQLITVALPLACGGVVLAYVYASTRCFWSSVITHACFNGINVVALVFFHAS